LPSRGVGKAEGSAVNRIGVRTSGGYINQLEPVVPDETPTEEASRAAIRAVGSGSLSIDVVYHQKGTAKRMSKGKERVTASRMKDLGLSVEANSEGRGRLFVG